MGGRVRSVDPELIAFARSFRNLADAAWRLAPGEEELSELGHHVQDFLGVDLTAVEPVSETTLTCRTPWTRCCPMPRR